MAFQNGNHRGLDPFRLRLLVEVGRRGSIEAAAEAVGVAQPSASKHLRALAATVGRPLVEREGRASRLTAAGRLVAARAGEVLAALDHLDDELAALGRGAHGRLLVAASPTASTYLLPRVLRALAERHPAVEVHLTVGDADWVADRVERGEAHLGVAGPATAPARMLAEPVADDEILAVAHPDVFRIRTEIGVDELVAHTLLLREPGSTAHAVAERAFARAGRRPARLWPMNSNEAIKRAMAEGLGVALLCRMSVAEELADNRLVARRLPPDLRAAAQIVLLRPRGRDLAPPAEALRELLLAGDHHVTGLRAAS